MQLRERVLNALLRKEIDRKPALCVNSTATLDQMETIGVYWPEAHSSPHAMAKLASAAYKVTKLEGVRVPFDQTVEAEAFGCQLFWKGRKDEIPAVKSTPFSGKFEDIKKPSEFLKRKRVPVVVQAVKILKSEVGNTLPVMAGIVGPFSLLVNLGGVKEVFLTAYKNPERLENTLSLLTEVAVEYGNELFDAGVDVVVIEDMYASGQMTGGRAKIFDRLVKPALKEVMKNLRGVKILHICGGCNNTIGSMVETGANALSIDNKTDLRLAREKAGRDIAIVGNLDTGLLSHGTPQKVKEESINALKEGVDLLAPGCSLDPYTPAINVKAMVEAVQS
jgi:[methyl-Co(III) methanol-specific corrinoid protein]:coenzyme M methyltransferase